MALPVPPNTTCDIYEPGNSPPSSPDASGVACYLKSAFGLGLETGEETDLAELESKFTHIMMVDAAVNSVEDGHSAGSFSTGLSSLVYVPDQDGTEFVVVFVERKHAGAAHDHKNVYLRRATVNWPTDDL